MMDSGSDPIPDAKSADFECCRGRDAPCLDRLVLRSSDFGFYTQMISVKREILIDDSLRLNAMQGHGLEDADMPASQWRLGGKCRTFYSESTTNPTGIPMQFVGKMLLYF